MCGRSVPAAGCLVKALRVRVFRNRRGGFHDCLHEFLLHDAASRGFGGRDLAHSLVLPARIVRLWDRGRHAEPASLAVPLLETEGVGPLQLSSRRLRGAMADPLRSCGARARSWPLHWWALLTGMSSQQSDPRQLSCQSLDASSAVHLNVTRLRQSGRFRFESGGPAAGSAGLRAGCGSGGSGGSSVHREYADAVPMSLHGQRPVAWRWRAMPTPRHP